jgi:putative zinc finger protein
MSSLLRGNYGTGGGSCGNREALVAYLYDECDPEERAALDTHLLTCLTCATELRGLRGVRTSLAEWTAPDVPLGFRIDEEPVGRAWLWPVPVWLQAVAATVLVLAGGAAIANLEVRYGADGMVVRTGWQQSATPAVGEMSRAMPASSPAQAAWRSELAAAVADLRREFAASDARAGAGPVAVRSTAGDQDVLRRVQALIDRSEQRQQQELAIRFQQLLRDFQTTRSADLARIEESIGRMQVDTGKAIVTQKNYADMLFRTSQRQPQ